MRESLLALHAADYLYIIILLLSRCRPPNGIGQAWAFISSDHVLHAPPLQHSFQSGLLDIHTHFSSPM